MAVLVDDVISEAYNLKDNSHSEISIRNSISRGYYGFYHKALEYIEYIEKNTDEIKIENSCGDHAKLRIKYDKLAARINEHGQKSRYRRVCKLIKECHRKRCDADYKLYLDISEEELDIFFHKIQDGINAIKKAKERDEFIY